VAKRSSKKPRYGVQKQSVLRSEGVGGSREVVFLTANTNVGIAATPKIPITKPVMIVVPITNKPVMIVFCKLFPPRQVLVLRSAQSGLDLFIDI
jgi:hypothetical protein